MNSTAPGYGLLRHLSAWDRNVSTTMENENPNLLHAVLKEIQECIVVTFPIRLYDRCALRFNNPPTGIHYDMVIFAQPGLNRAGSTDS